MKTILVVLDGLSDQIARYTMGYLFAECAEGKGQHYTVTCELPSLSRPLYECILTGRTPVQSGIVHNGISRLSKEHSIFHYAHNHGLTTAAAAYHWVSELYNGTPFQPARDRHTTNPSLPIQYGHFYSDDRYPDSHLFEDAESLRLNYDPDFLLIHPMNIDDAGHRYGLNSEEYRNMARMADGYLSLWMPQWLASGYQIMVTADHGMTADRSHGGLLPEEMRVPLFVFGEAFSLQETLVVRQTELCGTLCAVLDVDHDKPVCQALLATKQELI